MKSRHSIVACLLPFAFISSAWAADQDRDKINDEDDWCPTVKETVNGKDDDDGCPDEVGELIKLEDNKITIRDKIGFLSGKTKILGRSRPLLNRVAQLIKENPQIQLIEVQGYTDDTGSKAKNVKMSQLRANAVLKALSSRGVARSRLQSKGFGPQSPIESNDTPKGRAANRRVQFAILKMGKKEKPVVSSKNSALMISSHGEVTVDFPSGISKGGSKGLTVPNAAVITTGAAGSCTLRMPTGTRSNVGENSRIKVWTKGVKGGHRSRLKMITGSIWSKVTGMFGVGKEKFEVETHNSVAGVRGTEFNISVREVDGKPVTELSTTEGSVALTVGDKTVEVPAGQGVVAKGDPKVAPVEVSPPRALPAAPTELKPYWGGYLDTVEMSWQAVDGATYRIEIARDSFFSEVVVNQGVKVSKFVFETKEAGKYFWRVRSIVEGLEGQASKIFEIEMKVSDKRVPDAPDSDAGEGRINGSETTVQP